MDSDIYIANSQIVFAFKRNYGIRRRVFEFEDKVNEFFKVPFKTISVSDNENENIPRFESISHNEHSKIQVSQSRITLITHYDEKFRPNIMEVREYLSNRFELLKPLAQSEELQFVAYIIELGSIFDKNKLNTFIKENTGAYAVTDKCRDFQLLYSIKYKENYFLNIRNSKFAKDEYKLDSQTNTLKPTGNKQHGISVIVDINSRPYFQKHQTVNEEIFQNIEYYTFTLIDISEIKDYLQGNIKN